MVNITSYRRVSLFRHARLYQVAPPSFPHQFDVQGLEDVPFPACDLVEFFAGGTITYGILFRCVLTFRRVWARTSLAHVAMFQKGAHTMANKNLKLAVFAALSI